MKLFRAAVITLVLVFVLVIAAKLLEPQGKRVLSTEVKRWVRSGMADITMNSARVAQAAKDDRLLRYTAASQGLAKLQVLAGGPWTEADLTAVTGVNAADIRAKLEYARSQALEEMVASDPSLDGDTVLGLASRVAMYSEG